VTDEPQVGKRYRRIDGGGVVVVDSVASVDIPPPDSFDAAHPESWRKERVVYHHPLLNPIPLDRFLIEFEPVPDEDQ